MVALRKTALLVTSLTTSFVGVPAFENAAKAASGALPTSTTQVVVDGDATIANGVVISSDDSTKSPLLIDVSSAPITITNDGTVQHSLPNATTSAGIGIKTGGSQTLTFQNNSTGTVEAASEHAFDLGNTTGAVDITNAGNITAQTQATNNGKYAIEGSSATGVLTVTNTGTITGGIYLPDSAGNVINLSGNVAPSFVGFSSSATNAESRQSLIGNGTVTIDGTGAASTSDTLNFNDVGTKTIRGGAINGVETINVNNGLAQIWADINGTNTLTVASGASLILDNSTTNVSNFIVNGKMSLIDPTDQGSFDQTISGDFTLGSSGELEIKISNDSNNSGLLAVTNDVTINQGAQVTLSADDALTADSQISIVTVGGALTGNAASLNVNESSILYDFVLSSDNNNNIIVTVRSSDLTTVLDVRDARLASALSDLASNANNSNALQTVVDQLAGMSQTQLAEAAEQMSVQSTVAAPAVAVSQQHQAFATVSNRVSSLLPNTIAPATGETGISGGDTLLEKSMWLQAYGAFGDQGERKGVDGYDSRTYGFTVGIDTQTDALDAIGAFFTYANSNVDSDGVGDDKLDIDNYSFGIYGAKSYGSSYVEAMGSVGFNDYSGSRLTIGNEVASRDYKGMQYAINVEGGRTFSVTDAFLLTPRVGLQYVQIEDNSYTEQGAAAALNVDEKSSSSLRSSLGFDSSYTFESGGGPIYTTLLSAAWNRELIDDSNSISATFANSGAASFTASEGSSADDSFDIGVGIEVGFDDVSSLSLGYNLELKDQFTGHGGQLKYRYKF